MKILIDNGHGRETAGKRSPDGRLLEWSYNREIASRVVDALTSLGLDAELLVPEDEDISLYERCQRVNRLCLQLGKRNVCLVSIHVNAAGHGDKWYNAEGWCCYTTPGQTQGDILANHLCQAALQNLPGHRMRFDYTDGDADQEAAFYILKHTACASCLTENGFMDCHRSCDFLLSDEGKAAIVQLHIEGIKAYVNSLNQD